MNIQKQWYAVYTKPRWEKKVSTLLLKRNIENFCPVNKVVRQWADRKKTVHEPLISCYVFVHAESAEFTEIKKTDGILNFVHWLGKPAVIREEEIIALKDFLDTYKEVKLEKIHVNVNDKVRVINGPLTLREGNVLEIRKHSVKVLLPTLGYALVAEIQKSSIEVINISHSQVNSKQA